MEPKSAMIITNKIRTLVPNRKIYSDDNFYMKEIQAENRIE